MASYEYGVRHIKTGRIHRSGMTWDSAHEFVYGDEEFDYSKVFEVIRRPVSEWESVKDHDREL